MAAVLILSGLGLAGGMSFAAEFEVLDRFSVDGYTVLRGSADIPGGSFAVGGSALVVKDGKTGIGTTAPGAILHISSVNAASDQDFVKVTTGTSAGSDVFVIKGSGNIGIGTAAPGARLDVGGGVKLANDEGVCDTAKAGTIRFTGTNFQGCTGTTWLTLENSPPSVASVSPDNGAMGGLYTITVTGSGFGAPAVLTIGGNPATNVVTVSGTQITAAVPASSSSGAKDVVVTNPDGLKSTFTGGFRYNPGVTAISPDNGPVSGGTNITITGSGFVNGAAVKINNVSAANVTWNSATQITATTPAGSSGGAQNFTLTNPDGGYSLVTGGFRYNPVVAAVSPVNGQGSGGTGITITGSGFLSGATVKINGVSASNVIWNSATQITATTPVGSSNGAQDVKVTNSDSGYGVLAGAFTYNVYATGGTESDSGLYHIHKFTGGGTLTVYTGGSVEVLVVAGGGGGGKHSGGGGGAGGLIYRASYTVIAGTAKTVTVGNGGASYGGTYPAQGGGEGSNGGNSVFDTLTALGGGGGGYHSSGGLPGGSGGGAGRSIALTGTATQPGSASGGFGNTGGPVGGGDSPNYPASGGGGAGAVGGNGSQSAGGNGGAGKEYSISGAAVYYAGGGGGNIQYNDMPGGSGGLGGGGAGGRGNTDGKGNDATANTGGGGGGSRYDSDNNTAPYRGYGGSGIVIIRYLK